MQTTEKASERLHKIGVDDKELILLNKVSRRKFTAGFLF
ncbi:DUF6471 domain-containing protein [Aurantimonas sp. C2-3-R2]